MIGQRNYFGFGFTTIETRSSKDGLGCSRHLQVGGCRHGTHSVFQGKGRSVRVALRFDIAQKELSVIVVSSMAIIVKKTNLFCILQAMQNYNK